MGELPAKRHYRPEELAREMGVTLETVRRWLRKDLVNHVHLPKGVRIPSEEFWWIVQHGPRPRPM